MTRKERSKRDEELLNSTALKWKAVVASENETASVIQESVFLQALKLYDDGTEAFLNVLLEVMERYDGKSRFSNYLNFTWSRRKNDAYNDILNRDKQVDRLEAPVSSKDSRELGDAIPAGTKDEPENYYMISVPFAQLTAQVLNFAQRHQGKERNETRQNWFRIFYTEDITASLKITNIPLLCQRDVFSAMKVSYLDYFMAANCRTMPQITRTPLKPYSKVVPARGGHDEETPLPIPADVSLAYMEACEQKLVGASARSNQKKYYDAEKKAIYEQVVTC